MAENLATNIGGASFAVRQNAARGRQDGDAKPVIDARKITNAVIHTATRARHPLNLGNDRLTVMVFQLDLKFLDSGAYIDAGIVADIALALQHLEYIGAETG